MALVNPAVKAALKRAPGLTGLWGYLHRLRKYSHYQWLRTVLPLQLRFPGLFGVKQRNHHLSDSVIVSLTSHPPRFWCLALTLQCLLRQSVKPDHLILWIAHDHQSLLPRSVLDLQRYGLKIEFVDDWKPYKKLLPAIDKFGFDVNHVIVDDDMYQSPRWLETLLAEPVSDEVVCHFGRFWRDEDGHISNYREWPAMPPGAVSKRGFLIGHGGVWFPPNSLGPGVCNYNLAKQLCPMQDDIWLTWHALMQGKRIRRTAAATRRFSWPGADADGVALSDQNNPPEGGNDLAVKRMIAHYGVPAK